MNDLRRGLRALVYAWRAFRSFLLLTSYRMLYSGLRVGRRVRLGRGVYLNVASGGRIVIGDDVLIEANVHLTADGGMIEIDSDSYIGAGAVIVATQHISIGRDALIAAYVTIRDQDHGFDAVGIPFRAQPLVADPVSIGSNVWLGTHAAILRGVTIGANSVVGANAVVSRDLPAGSLSVGIPARPIRDITGASPPDRQDDCAT